MISEKKKNWKVQRAYRAYFNLVPFKIVLCEGGEQEDNLCLDDGMNIRSRRIVHVGRPGRSHRAPSNAPRTGRRFE